MSTEKELKIPVDAAVHVYGTLRGELDQSLIIFVHGLTGNRNEHIFYNGARFFDKHGFATFRYDQYGPAFDTRKLAEMTLAKQSQDLAKVIEYFTQQGVPKVAVVGHSYGGPTILILKDPAIDAAVLWDPTYIGDFFDNPSDPESAVYDPNLDAYVAQWNAPTILPKAMVAEGKQLDGLQLIARFHVPVKIVTCQEGSEKSWPNIANRWLEAANEPKSVVSLQWADHNFNTGETEHELFTETLGWVEQYLRL